MAAIHTATFGLSIPGQTQPVSEDDWNLFLVEQICPRLVGFSVRDELGFWQGEPEPCKVLTVISASGSAAAIDAHLRDLARLWAITFKQDAVLVTCRPSKALMVTPTDTVKM